MYTTTKNMNFSNDHLDDILYYLNELPHKFYGGVKKAPMKKDLEEAVDLLLTNDSEEGGARVRRKWYWESSKLKLDWTVRYSLASGKQTEIHKLLEGFCQFYFMGWSLNDKDKLWGWVLIDVNKVREQNILYGAYPIETNKYDKNRFRCFPIYRLRELGCLRYEMFPKDVNKFLIY